MSFASSSFWLFLTVFLGGTLTLRGRARVLFYTLASYYFYAAAFPPYVFLLLGSSLLDFHIGKRLENDETPWRRRALVTLSLACNLGLLATFKYAGFAATQLNRAFEIVGAGFEVPVPHLLLPVGISFYTFQTLSYTIDVYRRQCPTERSLLNFMCYVAFFPQLVAGPIVRATEFLPQIENHRPLRGDVVRGVELVMVGLFKKLVVADNAAGLLRRVFSHPDEYGGGAHWFAALFFAAQIYGDFSGYSDVARGLARVLGFHLPVNFRWPYFARSIAEFWRRWHITLSFWLRDYLYFSLGGSRVGRMRFGVNVLITWFLSGLWHGAAWTFVAWGLLHGGVVTAERLLGRTRFGRWAGGLPLAAKIGYAFTLTLVAWVPFRAKGLRDTLLMWKSMCGLGELPFWEGADPFLGPPVVLLGCAAVLHGVTYALDYDVDERSVLSGRPYPLQLLALVVCILVLLTFAGPPTDFIYFAF